MIPQESRGGIKWKRTLYSTDEVPASLMGERNSSLDAFIRGERSHLPYEMKGRV